MGSVTVDVWNIPQAQFVPVSPIEEATISRRVGTSEATFLVAPADLADRKNIVNGLEAHVVMTQGEETIRFRGFVEKPKVIVNDPRQFNLLVTCVGYEHDATVRWITRKEYSNAEAYTTIINDLWSNHWSAVDRTKVVASAKTLPANETLPFQYTSLAQATNALIARLDDYVWWLEWDGTTDYLRVEPKGNTASGKTFDENDIRPSYEMEPLVSDVRNTIFVIGGQGGGEDPLNPGNNSDLSPVKGNATDSDSILVHRTRPLYIKDPSADTSEQAKDRAETERDKRAWPTWRGQFSVRDFALEVGQRVTLSLPTIGVNGTDFGDQYTVGKTVDHYRRGTIRRQVVFEEIVPPVLGP